MRSPLIHCVVLSYNGKELTLDCLHSLFEDTYPNKKIVVVDNHSSDGSASAIRQGFSNQLRDDRMKLLETAKNLGFAGGNNLGIRYAMDSEADYILLLNNDTKVDSLLVSSLVSWMEKNPDVGICAPKIYFFHPPDMIWFAGAELKLYKGLSQHIGIRHKDNAQFDAVKDCDYVTGCAMFIRRSVIESIGLLDTGFRMYGEDADYCFRAKERGFRIAYVPAGKVWHKVSAAVGGQLRLRKIILRIQSNLRFFRRHGHWWQVPSVLLFHFLEAFRVLVLATRGRLRS